MTMTMKSFLNGAKCPNPSHLIAFAQGLHGLGADRSRGGEMSTFSDPQCICKPKSGNVLLNLYFCMNLHKTKISLFI